MIFRELKKIVKREPLALLRTFPFKHDEFGPSFNKCERINMFHPSMQCIFLKSSYFCQVQKTREKMNKTEDVTNLRGQVFRKSTYVLGIDMSLHV